MSPLGAHAPVFGQVFREKEIACSVPLGLARSEGDVAVGGPQILMARHIARSAQVATLGDPARGPRAPQIAEVAPLRANESFSTIFLRDSGRRRSDDIGSKMDQAGDEAKDT